MFPAPSTGVRFSTRFPSTTIPVPSAIQIPPSRAVRSRGFSMSLALIFMYYVPLTVGQTLADKGIVPAVVGLWRFDSGAYAHDRPAGSCQG